jgi:hypothetical protein
MTEHEWLACTDPKPMLRFLRGQASDRKLRLFAVGCCRRIWPLLPNERSRKGVEVAELYADGRTRLSALLGAYRESGDVPASDAARAANWATDAATNAHEAARLSADWATSAAARARIVRVAEEATAAGHALGNLWAPEVWEGAKGIESRPQALLLRDLFGPLPFRSITIAPSVLTWNARTVQRLAEAAYEERQLPAGILDPARLAVLADAVEEAGCMDAELLGHLRGPGPHVRGCWVVDWLLGRK